MLFIPPVLQGPFDRRYIIAHFSFPGSPENLFGDRSAASFLVNQLRVPVGFWESLIATRSEYDLRYLDAAPNELIIDLLSSSLFKAYALPSEAEIEAFSRYNRFDSASGCHYRLLPRNGHLLSGVQAIRPYSPAQFDDLLQRLDLSEQQLNEITDSLPEKVSARVSSPRSRLFNALLDYELVAAADMVPAPLVEESSGTVDSAYTPAQSTLGPHDSPDYVAPPPSEAPVPASAPDTPAESLEECEKRLQDAKKRLQVHGYVPKYTDEELLAMAQKGELDDRFIVRFTKTEYAADDKHLSQAHDDGSVRSWVTTFNQIENADTDPEIIAAVLGVPYDPAASYSLIVVDTHAPGADQAVTIVPTYKNLGEMAKSEIKDIDPELVDQVMTEEYSKVYAEAVEALTTAGLDIQNSEEVSAFANRTFTTSKDVASFETRAIIQQEYGANHHYTGNGATKNLLPADQRCGAMEVLNVDKNPELIGRLIDNKAAVRVLCTSA